MSEEQTAPKASDHKTDKEPCKHVYDELAEPQNIEVDREHALCGPALNALREIYDPEIPVNVYELGLIYGVYFEDDSDKNVTDISIKMTLTSPGCPVAQEMPGWIQGAILPIDGVGEVDVEVIWDPPWTPAMMSETAKMQLNMFS